MRTLADWLDNRFRLPGTNWRFGIDAVVGLFPYVGDIVGLLVSLYLLGVMLRFGAGPLVMLRLVGNMGIDALVGIVPFVGDLFDFGYKANRRNVDLLHQYYSSGEKRPSAALSIALLVFLTFLLLVGITVGVWYLAAHSLLSLGQWIFG